MSTEIAIDIAKPEIASARPTRSLQWSNITYEIPVKAKKNAAASAENAGEKKETRTLLKDITGAAYSGELVAIMGSSGAGKTTLLNCLSGRLSNGTLSGSILYNGHARDPKTWRKTIAFVEQEDALYSQITVRETLRYAAQLRLPSSDFTAAEKRERADAVLKSLRLTKAADTPIGDADTRGVSGGEKKRAAIGQELVGNPDILFLDEPTSGLDSNSALAVIENVKSEAATSGRIVVSTIHQPSWELLTKFDKLVLLSGGSTVFFGAPEDAIDYFEAQGFQGRPNQNPADFFIDLLTIDSSKTEASVADDLARIAGFHKAFAARPASSNSSSRTSLASGFLTNGDAKVDAAVTPEAEPAMQRHIHWANNWIGEFRVLLDRSSRQILRGRSVLIADIMRAIVLTLLIGFTFFQLKTDQKGIQNRIGILFFWPVNQVFSSIMPVVGVFPLERVIMSRERAAGSYRVSSFFVAKFIAQAAQMSVSGLIAIIPLYFMIGLRLTVPNFLFWVLTQWIEMIASMAAGFMIASAVDSIQLAQVLGPVVGSIFLIYGGVLLNNADLFYLFRGFQYISPANYAFRANMYNEFDGLSFSCDPSAAHQCFTEGNQVLEQYSITEYGKWTSVGSLVALLAGYTTIAYLILRFAGKPKSKLL
ncbi:ATP-binding cassette sub- G member 2 [Irineochytrium annulatum]|nr:ATP-binding cassette sub- G member 2 [Irineochytrium annulatum]